MDLKEINALLYSDEYTFIRDNPNLGENIILLGLGGSHAYGLNSPSSDVDLRGIAMNTKRNLLLGKDFEQVVDTDTDTVIYSFDKIVRLLSECNQNVIELLGLKPEHYLYMSPEGKMLVENRKLFLSKRAIHSFGGYAHAQLRRMEHKAARVAGQSHMEADILKSIEHASYDYKEKFFFYPNDAIKLYIDKAVNEDFDTEIFMDLNLKHYPLRDYRGMWNEFNAIVKAYNKFGARNSKAISHDKLGKHMRQLVLLYLMCFDILEHGEITTYREKEHDFLMSVQNGKYLDENKQPTSEFYKIVDSLDQRLEYLKEHTNLPERADMAAIEDLIVQINTNAK